MRARRQVAVMLATVVCVFFICLFPLRVFLLFVLQANASTIQQLGMEPYYNLLYFSRIMFYVNSCINPILYNMTSTRFRNAFWKVVTGKKYRRGENSRSSSYLHHTTSFNHSMYAKHLNNSFSFNTTTTMNSPGTRRAASSRLYHHPSSASICSMTSHGHAISRNSSISHGVSRNSSMNQGYNRNSSVSFPKRYTSITDSVV